MDDDFEPEDVIDLAEKIFIRHVKIKASDTIITEEAHMAIKAAMIFRQAQLEIFKEED